MSYKNMYKQNPVYIIVHWLVLALAVAITSYMLDGVYVESFLAAVVAAIVLGLVNAFIRPLLVLLTLPLNIITLGLFMLIINASLVLFTSRVVPGFVVDGFWWAASFSVVLFLINIGLDNVTRLPRREEVV